MAKNLISVKATKAGLPVSNLKVTDLDPNILTGIISINDNGGRKVARWKYDKESNSAIYALDYKEGEVEGRFDLNLKGVRVHKSELFTLRRSSWHAKFFNWLYDIKPDEEYKGACPYLWAYIFTFLFIYLVIPARLIGYVGISIITTIRSEYRRNRENNIREFVDVHNRIGLSLKPKECWKLYKSYCCQDHYLTLDWKVRNHISDGYIAYSRELETEKANREAKRKAALTAYKDQAKENNIIKAIGGIIFIGILYCIYELLSAVSPSAIGFWDFLYEHRVEIGIFIWGGIKIALACIVAGYSLYGIVWIPGAWLIKYINKNWSTPDWITSVGICISSAWDYLCKVFALLVELAIAIYENNCPTLTWKD